MPQIISITGQSGTGKTTVIQQLFRLKCSILCGRTDSVENTAFHSLQPIVDAILGADTPDKIPKVNLSDPKPKTNGKKQIKASTIWEVSQDMEEPTEKKRRKPVRKRSADIIMKRTVKHGRQSSILHSLVARDAIEVAKLPLLNMILPIDIPETAYTLSLTEEDRHRQLLVILAELIQEATEASPIVLVFDDAHFMDETTANFLHFFCTKNPQSIYLVLALRNDRGIEVPTKLESISALPQVEKVE